MWLGWEGLYLSNNDSQSGFATQNSVGLLKNQFDFKGDYYILALEKSANDVLIGEYLDGTNIYGEHFHFGEQKFDDHGIPYQSVCICVDQDNPNPGFPTFPNSSIDAVYSLGIGRNKNNNSSPNITGVFFPFLHQNIIAIQWRKSEHKYQSRQRDTLFKNS